MRLLFIGVILFAMFSLALGQMENESSAQNNAEQELKRLENEWLNSYLRGDKQTSTELLRMISPRTDESGKFATKAEERALIQAPPAASVNASLTNEDMQLRVYGNAAIVTGRIVSKVQGTLNFQSRFTDTFINANGVGKLLPGITAESRRNA